MIVVLTDLRRPDYLGASLADVDSSATEHNRVVLVDGTTSPAVPEHWRVVLAPKPMRARPTENRWTTWRAFELAVEAREDLLFLEDDVVGCPNAARYAEAFAVPDDCALVMFYAPWGDVTMPWALWRVGASRFSFCQAVKFPLRTCQALWDARPEMEAISLPGSDECIREIGMSRDWRIGVHYPGLYQHVGQRSVVTGDDQCLLGLKVSRAWAAPMDVLPLMRTPWREGYR